MGRRGSQNENSIMRQFDNVNSQRPIKTSCLWLSGWCEIGLSMLLILLSVAHGADSRQKATQQTPSERRKIPFDVFFPNPLQIVGDGTSKSDDREQPSAPESTDRSADSSERMPVAKKDPAAKKEPVEKEAEKPAAGATGEWPRLISMAELQAEVKTLRNELTQILANQGQFNKNFKLASVNGAELSVLASIAPQLEGTLIWKDHAKYVRDFSVELSEAAKGLGRENFEKAKVAFIKLKIVLDGSIPADAGDVEELRPFHEFASRKKLMRRIETAKEMLKQNINSEARFKSMADQIRHESELVSILGIIIRSSGYDYVEEADFQNFANSLIESARELSDSVTGESYEQFKRAIDKMNKSCADCHGAYGNG